MTSTWLQLPRALVPFPHPCLVEYAALDVLRSSLVAEAATVVEFDLSSATSSMDVIEALRRVLPFPDWCGSGWDSMDDAFEELRAAWPFPLVVIAHGLPDLLASRTHLALEVVLEFERLERAFSLGQQQYVQLYPGEAWR